MRSRTPHGKGQSYGERGAYCKIWGLIAMSCKNGWTNRDAIWDTESVDQWNQILDGGPDLPIGRGNFEGTTCPDMPEDTLPWAVQKWLNQSRCHVGCGVGWAKGNMYYMGAHRHYLINTTEPSVCGGDVALCEVTMTTYYISREA